MKPRIIFLHSNILKFGGASKVVLEQSSRLASRGYPVEVVTTKINSNLTTNYHQLRITSLSEYSTGTLFFWISFPWFFIKLFKHLNKFDNKILYCHSLAIYWGYLYKLLSPQTKTVLYFHDLGFPYFDSPAEKNSLTKQARNIINILSPIFRPLHCSIMAVADKIIANSQSTSHQLDLLYHRHPDIVVYPGIDQKIFHPHHPKHNYFITVGRLEKIKNIETTIQGFSLFKHNHPNNQSKLYIVGDGPEKTKLVELTASLGIKSQVNFLSAQPPLIVSKLFGQAKMGIFMSPHESFGLTTLECLACHTPAIGVNQNGIGEITKQFNPSLVIKNSATKLSQLLTTTSNTPNKFSLLKKYSWDYQVYRLANFFTTLC